MSVTTPSDGRVPGTDRRGTRRFGPRDVAAFTVTSVGFPLGGLVALAIGPVISSTAALLGGGAAGTVIGASQWTVLRRLGVGPAWVAATAAGLAGGLGVGAAAVGYGTAGLDLAIQGAVTGVGVGAAQSLVLRPVLGPVRSVVWALLAPLLWSLGWTVTWAAGVGVDAQFAVFGATGALAYSALAGACVAWLAGVRRR
jgi:hypothetical protein